MTHFRSDGIFNDIFIANFQEIVKVKKKLKNRSVFDEVMPKILLVPFFSGHGVHVYILSRAKYNDKDTTGVYLESLSLW